MASSNSPKFRDFFITINKGAECYEDIEKILCELNIKMYGLITHDKDKILNSKTGEWEEKTIHKHLMLEVKNPVSFERMQERFKGAHIEIPKYKKSAYCYLVHNLPSAKEKYQYSVENIITNSPQELKVIIASEDNLELFKENMFLDYIADGTRTSYQFVKRFGLNAYKQYWKAYSDMLEQLEHDEEMQRDLNILKTEREQKELPF